MRADYSDAEMRRKIYELLDTCFPRLAPRIVRAEAAGARWHEVSTPFVHREGNRVVAHAGVIEIPMVIAGERRLVAGIHAVCTHPAHRERGHARAVLRAALAHADARTPLALLTTGIPSLYERMGFQIVHEQIACPMVRAPQKARPPARRLSCDVPDDVALLHRLLARRSPVSNALASLDEGWLFVIDEVLASDGFRRLFALEDLDAVVACETAGSTLRLLDVVGPTLPRLEHILARLPHRFTDVECHVVPERIWSGGVRYREPDPGDLLMVRGAWPPLTRVMLSPLARC